MLSKRSKNMSNKPMDHKQYQYLLPDYAAGTLDPANTNILTAHLQDCADCNQRLEGFRQVINELRSSQERYRVPDDYFATILPRFRARYSGQAERPAGFGWMQLAQPFAAAIIIVGLLVSVRLTAGSESGGLRALAAELEPSELTEAFLSEIDQQPLASAGGLDAVAGVLARESIAWQLLDRIADSSDPMPLESVDDLENDELDVLLQRLETRKYL